MNSPLVVVGIDGAPADALDRFDLPFLRRVYARGVAGPLASTTPAMTLPAWTSAWTGLGPGGHGVWDFTRVERLVGGHPRVRFVGGAARRARTIFAALAEAGLRVGVVGFPGTYPPETLAGGFVVAGWDSPVAHAGDASYVSPRDLHSWIVERHGPIRFDDVNEFRADAGWHERLADRLVERVGRRARLAADLAARFRPDALFVYFGESDTAAHHLWSFYDSRSPRHAPGPREGLGRVYRAIDDAAATLVDALRRFCGEPAVLALSDHGSGGASDKVLYLNRALADAGLLAFRGRRSSWAPRVRGLATRVLPGALRDRLFRARGGAIASWLESRVRFGAIDFDRSVAWSEELNYAPSVWLDDPGAAPAVARALEALRDPWSGAPVVRRVVAREEIAQGPFVSEAPHLFLDLAGDGGYTYNLLPSSGAPAALDGPWRRLGRDEWAGRKGAALSGSHRPDGLVVTDLDAPLPRSIPAVAPLVASACGVPFVPTTVDAPLPARDHALVLDRLRALGYVD